MLRLFISECGLLKKENENEKDHCNNSSIIQHFECVNAQKLDLIPSPVKIKQREKVFVIPSSIQIVVDKQHQLPLRERVAVIRFLTEQIENQCTLCQF
jgi:hypothetical protein